MGTLYLICLVSVDDMNDLEEYLLLSATYLWQGNVFTGICHSVPRGGVWQTPPWANTTQADTPPPPQQTATAADGTHPTGMHSRYSVQIYPSEYHGDIMSVELKLRKLLSPNRIKYENIGNFQLRSDQWCHF